MEQKFLPVSIFCFPILLLTFSCSANKENIRTFDFADNLERIWVGPDFWANRLQDWEISDGKLRCVTSSDNRNIQLLTYNLDSSSGSFKVRTKLGFTDEASSKTGWIGIRFATKGEFNDYRDDAVYGNGIDVGITTDHKFFLGNYVESLNLPAGQNTYVIELEGNETDGHYRITGSLFSGNSENLFGIITIDTLDAKDIVGNIGVVSSFDSAKAFNRDRSAWFDNISIGGDKIINNPGHAYGPILFTQYTLSKEILKMTAQFPPLGSQDNNSATLEIFDSTGQKWINGSESELDSDSRIATFKINNWSFKSAVPYRINYSYLDYDGTMMNSSFDGIIQPDPVEKPVIKVAAFTGNNDLGFPDNDLIESVQKHDPDLFFFSGDQIYERVGGYGVQREPVEMAILDYLRKWYQFGWIYRDLIRSRPSVALPDDHDVFHGNIWGANGKATPPGLMGTEAQDQGGYKMPAEFVNMVQATQTSHLPDPYDATPVLQGIKVYYTDLTYGGISFAILEDRKFKSAPTPLLPSGKIWNGWAQNPEFDPKTQSDHPDAQLLGDRQLKFLNEWSADWSGGTWMKVVLSQTIFANVATLPEEEVHDQNVPKLRILEKNEYAPNDKLVADMDSNGWPKSPRDEALRIIRKAFAVHIAGDQHLGSTIQYGIDEYGDAGYAICVPSVSNIWPRRWYPPNEGANHMQNTLKYTGDYEDGFGNKMTVLAVSNPAFTGREPGRLYDRATGYGIIEFHRNSRQINMANWPRDADPDNPDSKPYEGWPVSINQLDNYHPKGYLSLAKIEVTGMDNAVIQVIEEESNEIVYTIRIQGSSFAPPVFKNGKFKIHVGNPDGEMREISGLRPGGDQKLIIDF